MSEQIKRTKWRGLILGAAVVATLVGVPAAAHAVDYTYFNGQLPMSTWKWSGHQNMTGAKAYGVNYAQPMYLQNDGFAQVQGYEYIFTSHSRTFTVSKCTWYSPLAQPGTTALQVCKYTN
ncbi:hypothetical protein ACEYYH_12245 [Microbacterium trichothecenolyticum]|uniref:hypothetical protein n=1 Tax=Microbacterium trichothecenolyticum TaxID=69370 RepID=UPI0035BE2162